jgi:hypothetical protein
MIALLLCAALSVSAVSPPGPAETKPSEPKTLLLSLGTTIRLQMTSKRPITTVHVDRAGIIRVQPAVNDQTTLLVTGLTPGRAVITLTDDQGNIEVHNLGKQ